MNARRQFLRGLALGVAALYLRLRPEAVAEVSATEYGNWGVMEYRITRAFKPLYDLQGVPLAIRGVVPIIFKSAL